MAPRQIIVIPFSPSYPTIPSPSFSRSSYFLRFFLSFSTHSISILTDPVLITLSSTHNSIPLIIGTSDSFFSQPAASQRPAHAPPLACLLLSTARPNLPLCL